jgi:cytochrome c
MHNRTNRTPGMALSILTSAAIAGSILMAGAGVGRAASVADPGRGREAFEKRCTGCHDLDRIKVGPPLRGIFGRAAGKDPHFTYSEAMKRTPVRWEESTLDRWLADTDSVIPDNDMAYRLNDAAERANIIAYLRQMAVK